jgi:predicted ATP-grasp superfamily ATP-dependent carboligase/protein-tyrosine-phosphatase
MPERVLLLGDDLRAFLAIARSLGRRGVEVHAAPSDFSSPALKSRFIAAAHRLPPYPLDSAAWEKALARLIAEKSIRIVFPTSDSGLFMLRHHAEALGRERIGIANEAALARFTDKSETRALARAHGVPVAEGMLLDGNETPADLAAMLGLPLILKPRASYGLGDIETKRSALLVRTLEELEHELGGGAWRGAVAEAFFAGIGVGVSVLAREGRILAAYQHRRLREGSATGASTKRASERVEPTLLASVEPLAAAVGLTGVAMFEFRADRRRGRHILLEVNPRFWGSLPLAVAAGADFPRLYWDLAVHGREGAATYRPGVVKADLTGEFNRAVDRFEESTGFDRLRSAASGLATAAGLSLAKRTADSWSTDDPEPWREERRALASRARAALAKRLAGAGRGRRVRFEENVGRIFAGPKGRPLRILLVGRDNVCRSAFGERLLRLRLAGLPVEIASAGYVPRRGAFPPPAASVAAEAMAVDLAGHSSRAVSERDLERADALILFDSDTEWRLRQIAPEFAAEIVTLPDLHGAGAESFPAIAAALSRLAALLAERLSPAPLEEASRREAGSAQWQAA